jgi:tetratricopeptide (TPR) repeat protein
MSRLALQQAISLGLQHHQSGRLQQAEAIYRQVLQQQPNQPDALHLLGVIAQQVGRYDVAIELIGRAISSGLRTAAAYNNLGEAYRHTGNEARAAECYQTAVQIEPGFAGAHSNLGIVLANLGRRDEAMAAYARAIALDANAAEPHSNLGNLLAELGRQDEAIAEYRRAIALRPGYAEAYNNLATALEKQDQFAEAEREYRRAIELRPDFAEAINNLGSLYQKRSRLPEAVRWWQRTVEVNPNFADAYWNIGLAQLTMGDYARGWPGYEWRWRCSHSAKYWREYAGKPRWDGSPLDGRTILLYPEQGFGDVIQYARFVPMIAARGGRVILECHPELVELMRTLDDVVEVIPFRAEPPPFDTYQALMSVPLVLKVTLDNLPTKVPYLRADPARRDAWTARVTAPPNALKVGLVWGGRPIPDPKRSACLIDLAPLWSLPNVAWFSLQTADPAAQLADAPPGLITDLGRDLHDFADTAAAMPQLDLLITIDTAAAHLAGALGVRTWTMIPFAPDWRWMLDRADNAWYPTMRLFRQSRINDWTDVVAHIRNELAAVAR